MKKYNGVMNLSLRDMLVPSLLSAVLILFSGLAIGCSGDTFQKYKLDRVDNENPAVPDTSAPSISSIKVTSNNKVEVTYNEEVDSLTALTVSNYHIQGINRVQVLSSPAPALSSDNKTVTLTLSQGYLNGMQHGKDYTLLVQRVKDLNNNPVLTDFSTFVGRGQVYAEIKYNGSTMATESPWPAINTASPSLVVAGDGVVSYMYSFDDSAWCSEIKISDNDTIVMNSLSEGFHTLKVVGKNSDGKWQDVNESTVSSFTVDTVAPTAEFNRVPVSVTSATNCSIAVGGSGVSSYVYRFNSESWSDVIPVTTAITRKNLIAGTYTLSVRGYDDAGNIQTGMTDYTWQIIEDQPVAVLSGLPDKSSMMTSVGITVSGSDVNYYSYSINGTTSELCNVSDPISISGLREGTYTLVVTGQKTSDVITAGPAITYSWTVDRTAPVCTLSNTPLSPTNTQSTHIFVSSSGGDVVSYQYYLTTGTRKGELLGPINAATAIDLSGLPENNYTIQVMGIDAAGNIQSEASATQYSWSVDISAPAAMLSGLPATLTNTNSFSVSVGSSAGDIVAYKYLLDDGSGAAEWSSEIGVAARIGRISLPDGTYTLCVIGRDNAGNWQSMQADTEYTWTIDTAPPVAILGNRPAKVTSGTDAHFYVYGTGVVSFQYRLDNGSWSELKSRINSQGTVTTIDYTGLAEGTHTIEVIGVDLAGNRQSSDSSYVTVYSWDINSLLPSAVLSGTPSSYTNNTSISIIVSGCETYKYMIDNGSWTGPFSVSDPIAVSGFGEGSHVLSVIGQKTIGMNSVWQDSLYATSHTWTIDLTAPAATITGINPMQANWTSASSITVGIDSASFTVAGNGVYGYKIAHLTDADPAGYPAADKYSSEIDLTSDASTHQIGFVNLASVTHRLYVIARDEAGNWQDLDSATRYIWTVNTSAPVVALSSIATPTQAKDINVTVSGASDIVSYSYSLDGGAWSAETVLSLPIKATGLSDGWHHLYVVGKNSLGIWQDVSLASKVNETATADGWYVDTTAPDLSYFDFIFSSMPTNPTTATTASGITVQAISSGTGDSSVAAIKYRLVSGGVAGSWSSEVAVDSNTLSAVIPTLPESGSFSANEYAVDVMARDTLGNWTDGYKRSSSWKVVGGADLPIAVIGTGALKNPSNDKNPSFTISGTNIAQYQYSTDGGTIWSSWTAISSPTISLSFPSLVGAADGPKTLLVRGSKSTTIPPSAADLSNTAITQTVSQSTSVSWTLDTLAPADVLSNNPVSGSTTAATNVSVNVGGTGVISYQYSFDSTDTSSWLPVVSGFHVDRTVDYPVTKTFTSGSHTLYVKGFDQAGNESSIVSCSWAIVEPDLVAPVVKAVTSFTAGDLNFYWTTPDGTGSVYIQLASSSDFSSSIVTELKGNVGSYSYTPTDADIDNYYARVWVSRSVSPVGGWNTTNNCPSDTTFKGPGTRPGNNADMIQVVGHISGKVLDATAKTGVSGATVKIYDQKNSKYLSDKETTTNSSGVFTISNIPIRTLSKIMVNGTSKAVPYYLVFSSGSSLSRKNNVAVTKGMITDVGYVYLMSTTGSAGVLSGTIIQANDGVAIQGALITATSYAYDGNGDVVETSYGPYTSASNGVFTSVSALSSNVYSVTIKKDGYYSLSKDNVVINNATSINRQPLCETLSEPQVRVILTWGSTPADIDLHLVGPTAGTISTDTTGVNPSNRFHIGYKDSTSPYGMSDDCYNFSFDEGTAAYVTGRDQYGSKSTVSLVLDDTDGYGPEAINLFRFNGSQFAKGTYTYTVYRWSANSGTWGTDSISMAVYDSGGMVRENLFPSSVDPSSVGRYWKAMKIKILGNMRSKRTIIPVNEFDSLTYYTKSTLDW
jgi:uncharacterized protein YfaP (DUF2135 family)